MPNRQIDEDIEWFAILCMEGAGVGMAVIRGKLGN